MHTQCPDCHSVFALGAETLSVSRGNVRCGCCGCVFFAVESLCDELDQEGQIPTCFHSDRPPTLLAPDRDEAPMDDLFWPAPGADADELPFVDSEALAEEVGPADETPRISVAERAADMARQSPAMWFAWSGFFMLLFLAQWFWQNHDRLAREATWSPWVNRICVVLNCRVDRPVDLDRIRLVSRDIRSHPSVTDALMISATMQNQAEFAQPHPIVEISLADLSGQLVALRRFTPDEYLEPDADDIMAPGHLLPVVFEIVDPGQDAVAFEFAFR